MNKGEMVRLVARDTDLNIQEVGEAVNSFLKLATLGLAVGEEVSLRGFGKFETRDRPPVTLRNPRNGEPVHVPPRTTVVFLPSPNLKDRLNGDGT